MSCRWSRIVPPAERPVLDDDAPYAELVEAGRHEDFCWLARSQGIPEAAIHELWRQLTDRPSRSPDSRP